MIQSILKEIFWPTCLYTSCALSVKVSNFGKFPSRHLLLKVKKLPVFRTGTYSKHFSFPADFLKKHSNLQLFEILYIQSDFLLPLAKNPSVIRSFSKNFDLHWLKTQKINRSSDFTCTKKAVCTIYKSVFAIF